MQLKSNRSEFRTRTTTSVQVMKIWKSRTLFFEQHLTLRRQDGRQPTTFWLVVDSTSTTVVTKTLGVVLASERCFHLV
jgi:hypothetical protein